MPVTESSARRDTLAVSQCPSADRDMPMAKIADPLRDLGRPLPTRPEIAASWRRCAMMGLRPEAPVDRLEQVPINPDTRLLRAAGPVLDDIADELVDARFCVILADHDARIVDQRTGTPQLSSIMESVSAVRGTTFDEGHTGTNSIATVRELRRGVAVIGSEHYLDALKPFGCYGHPIIDPITHRLAGVLDITGRQEDVNDLLAPFLVRAAREIEERLFSSSRDGERTLLQQFQAATSRSAAPILALSDSVIMTNRAANATFAPQDYAVIRALLGECHARSEVVLTLYDGADATLELVPIDGADGMLVTRRDDPRLRTAQRSTAATVARTRPVSTTRSLLVIGEPGTGRTHRAQAHCWDIPHVTLDALDHTSWADWSRVLSRSPQDVTVVLENIDFLPPRSCARLRRHLADDPHHTIVATSTPENEDDSGHAALCAMFDERVELQPLRERRVELPGIAEEMLGQLGRRRLSAELLELLLRLPWPGNLSELRRVLTRMTATAVGPVLRAEDLPETYRSLASRRRLTPLEESEYQTIIEALDACGGNKARTAKQLGISRTTLYQRLRTYRITV